MSRSRHDINVGETIRAGLQLYRGEVVAIMRRTCLSLLDSATSDEQTAVPCTDELWVSRTGGVRIALTSSDREDDTLRALARLLEQLLPEFSDPDDELLASTRLLPSRLRATPGLPAITNVSELVEALATCGREEPVQVLRALAARASTFDTPTLLLPPAEDQLWPFTAEHSPLLTDSTGEYSERGATKVSVTDFAAEQALDSWPSESTPSAVVAAPMAVVDAQAAGELSRPRVRRLMQAAALIVLGIVVGFALARYGQVLSPTGAQLVNPSPAVSVSPGSSAHVKVGIAQSTDIRPPSAASSSDTRSAPGAPPDAASPANISDATTRQVIMPNVARPSERGSHNEPTAPSLSHDALAGAEPTPLKLPDGGEAFAPSFAATGTAILFHTGRDRAGRLLEAELNTTGAPLQVLTVLADGAKNHHPRLSPDERLMAFDSDRDGERAVYVAERDGSGIRRISPAGFAAVPTWSPDAKSLAFVRSEPQRPGVWNLWVHDFASGDLRRLTSYRYGQTWGGSWFPDAHRICYSHETELVVQDMASGTTETFRSPLDDHLLRTPAVSPDGRRIVFQVFRDGVWLLDLQSRKMRRIVADPTAQEFAWNPQGTRVAYQSHRDGQWRIWLAIV